MCHHSPCADNENEGNMSWIDPTLDTTTISLVLLCFRWPLKGPNGENSGIVTIMFCMELQEPEAWFGICQCKPL